MAHYVLVFKNKNSHEINETHHRFILTAKLLAKYLKRQGFKVIVFLKVNP